MENFVDFEDLGLSKHALKAILAKGFEEPTPIQALTIPAMLQEPCNIIAQAQTGTGKTAAFGLPLLDMIDPAATNVCALVLTPTRELAIQVSEEIHSLKGDIDIRTAPIYGGQSIDQQLRRLKKGVHIVVGTPGRVIDHIRRKTLDLSKIDYLILDEADEMLNMGFIEDIEMILEQTSESKRTLLFSATMPSRIKSLASKYMKGYKLLTVEKEQLTTNLTDQIYFEVKESDKFEALCRIVDIEDSFYGLIFCRTKKDVDVLVNKLIERSYDAEPIHGDIPQAQRERTLNKFKNRNVNILVATDVAARGIDVSDLTHVINYALPYNAEAYVHRIGRTGRAGKQGTAITFITPNEYKRLMYIQKFANTDIRKSMVPNVDEIIQAKKQKIQDDVTGLLEERIDSKFFGWAKSLLQEHNPTEILAALLSYSFEDELNPEVYGEIQHFGPRGVKLDKDGVARLCLALGKSHGGDVKSLKQLVLSRVDMQKRDIKDVQVMKAYTFFSVPFDKAELIVRAFNEKGQRPMVTYTKKRNKR